jgi:hypothetical protein
MTSASGITGLPSTTGASASSTSAIASSSAMVGTAGSTSLPVGDIVACAVIGTIVIVAIFVIAWYLIRTRKPRSTSSPPPPQNLPQSNHEVESTNPTEAADNTHESRDFEASGA